MTVSNHYWPFWLLRFTFCQSNFKLFDASLQCKFIRTFVLCSVWKMGEKCFCFLYYFICRLLWSHFFWKKTLNTLKLAFETNHGFCELHFFPDLSPMWFSDTFVWQLLVTCPNWIYSRKNLKNTKKNRKKVEFNLFFYKILNVKKMQPRTVSISLTYHFCDCTIPPMF